MTAVEFILNLVIGEDPQGKDVRVKDCINVDEIIQAKEMEKEQKIELLKSLVYSVCIGDDVEDVEEWLKEHELNKSE